jgi:trehalose/maltose hydrolase-like predicted phosphorylase
MFLRYTLTPLNYSGKVSFRTGIDGAIVNGGVERYKSLNQKHLMPLKEDAEAATQSLVVITTQSGIRLAMKAAYSLFDNGKQQELVLDQEIMPAAVSGIVTFDVLEGHTYSLVKKVALYSSKSDDVTEPEIEAGKAVASADDFDTALAKSAQAWARIWENIDIRLEGDRLTQKLLRFNLYHLMVSMSPHNENLDASITARGLHGEAYRGHIFWDELFILPYYCMTYPEVARSMLMYRYRRLDKAREYAAAHQYKGAMFPWQSGSDGREETQVIHLNPLSGSWDPDHSCLQRHVSLAIAYNVWQYYQITGDLAFMKQQGAEMFLEIARFWVSKAVWNALEGRYDIPEVMGPDEFHEQYPGAEQGGISNNAYTNIMVSWMLNLVPGLLDSLGEDRVTLRNKILLDEAELQQWATIAAKLKLDISADGIIAQYQGYFGLKELDWDYYRNKYGNVYRMDRILKSEGLSPDEFKVAKQADTLMTFYNLEKAEVDKILAGLSYQLPEDYLQKNLDYYLARTSHGSTLSRLVHARLASMAGLPDLSRQFFADALASDYVDIQGGTTGEGIHAGVMGGAILVFLTTFAGIRFTDGKLCLDSALQSQWTGIFFRLHYQGITYNINMGSTGLRVMADKDCALIVRGTVFKIRANSETHLSI